MEYNLKWKANEFCSIYFMEIIVNYVSQIIVYCVELSISII